MRNQALLLPIAVVGLAIAILYPLAFAYLLFWNLWWYDILLHFLGGAFVVAVARWSLASAPPSVLRLSRLRPLLFYIVITFFIGVLWEFFEFAADLTYVHSGYWVDTCTDLIMDMLGGAVAYLFLCVRRTPLAQPALQPENK